MELILVSAASGAGRSERSLSPTLGMIPGPGLGTFGEAKRAAAVTLSRNGPIN